MMAMVCVLYLPHEGRKVYDAKSNAYLDRKEATLITNLQKVARPTYVDCVREFHRAAERSKATVYEDTAWGKLRGLYQEELLASSAYLGPKEATRVVCITSGMHGVELPMGTMAQAAALRAWPRLGVASDVGLLCIHGLSPWASSHSHRNDERNCDPNRANLILLPGEVVPTPPEYTELHPYINPRVPDDVHYVKCLGAVLGYWVLNGVKAFKLDEGLKKLKKVIGSGQGAYRDGVFWAGDGHPTRTNTALRRIIRRCLPESVRHVALLDAHTGIGWPPENISLISHYGSESYQSRQMQRWYRQPLEKTIENDSVAVHSQGVIEAVFEDELSRFPRNPSFFGLCLEIAIAKLIRSAWAVSKRNCVGVYHYADPLAPLPEASRKEMDETFVLPTPVARERVVNKVLDLVADTARGVAWLPV